MLEAVFKHYLPPVVNQIETRLVETPTPPTKYPTLQANSQKGEAKDWSLGEAGFQRPVTASSLSPGKLSHRGLALGWTEVTLSV